MTRPLVGLDMFYYAPLTQDDAGGVVYDTPVRVNNAVSLTVNPNSQIQPFYADDGPREVFSQVGEIDVSIMVADLPPEDYAYLIGADYNAGTGVVDYSVDAAAPDVAIGFRAQKTNGSYRYVWLLKGKFGVPNMEHQTKEGSVNFQSQTINGKFMARTNDDQVFRRVDGDDTNAMAGLPGSWFASPDLGAAPAAITVASIVPADEADTIAVDSAIEWTFGEAVNPAFATSDYFAVYAGGSAIAGSVTFDTATPTVVTFTPTADMAATTVHIAIASAGVRGAAHGPLAADYITSFTTV